MCGQAVKLSGKLRPGTVLPQLSRGVRRGRHVSAGVKALVRDEVECKHFRSSSFVLRGSGSGMCERSGRDFDEAHLRSYLLSSAKMGSGTVRWSVALDASTIGGEDTSFSAVWLPCCNTGFWKFPHISDCPLI